VRLVPEVTGVSLVAAGYLGTIGCSGGLPVYREYSASMSVFRECKEELGHVGRYRDRCRTAPHGNIRVRYLRPTNTSVFTVTSMIVQFFRYDSSD